MAYLTPEQVAGELQVHRRTVYNWLRTGQLPGLKVGQRSWRINRSDLERFPKQNTTESERYYPDNSLKTATR